MKQKYLVLLVAALVIAIGAYVYTNQHPATSPVVSDNGQPNALQNNNLITNSNSNVASNQPDQDSIVVSTQSAGSSVTIDNLNLSKPGFVAIHSIDANGKAGAIIGTSNWLSAGVKQDLEINAAVKADLKYIAMLHIDNGDKKFDAAKDKAATGPMSMTTFTISK